MPGPVVVADDDVVLRTVERDDAAFLQRSCTDPRIRYSLGSIHHRSLSQQEEGIEHWVEEDGNAVFVACVDDEDAPAGHPGENETTPVGSFSARHVDGDRAWLAYWLVPEFHGEGYGTEAISLAVDYAFRSYDTPAVGVGAFAFNDASRGLLESLGFMEEGRRRKFMYVDGEHRDMVQYGLLREEWRG